jgi:membrane fusion protein, macrolide-specific efflux system
MNAALGAVAVAALAGGYFLVMPGSAASTDATQLTATVQRGVVSTTVTASGSVAPGRTAVAEFAVAGTIATVDVAVGQTVTAGQQLGTLDEAALKRAVAAADTALADARSTLASTRQDLQAATAARNAAAASPGGSPAGTTSLTSAKSAVLSAEQRVNDAQDAVDTATANLAAATLTAPIGGLVIAVNGTVGAATGSGGASAGGGSNTGFATIADVSTLTVTANIVEADIASVTVGQKAQLSFPALSGVTTAATVSAISPTATASNSIVSYATTITLDTIPPGLRLGQTATVTITTKSSAADALYVPAAAITTGSDGTSTVKVVKNGKTSSVIVVTGMVGDKGTEITSGLDAGETIVLGTVSAATAGTGTTRGNQPRGFFSGRFDTGNPFNGGGGSNSGGPSSGGPSSGGTTGGSR